MEVSCREGKSIKGAQFVERMSLHESFHMDLTVYEDAYGKSNRFSNVVVSLWLSSYSVYNMEICTRLHHQHDNMIKGFLLRTYMYTYLWYMFVMALGNTAMFICKVSVGCNAKELYMLCLYSSYVCRLTDCDDMLEAAVPFALAQSNRWRSEWWGVWGLGYRCRQDDSHVNVMEFQ